MTKLQLLLIIVSIAFLILSFRVYKRKKIWLPTFSLFFFWSCIVGIFALRIEWLNAIGITFGLNRGADLIVYASIILLFYFVFHLLNGVLKSWKDLTRFISTLAIQQAFQDAEEQILNWKNSTYWDDFVFNIRVYNEEKMLVQVIDEMLKFWVRKFIFVNDGSKDNSLSLLKRKKEEHPDILFIIISHTINRGGGAANKSWYEFVKKYADLLQVKRFVGFDPDGQMDIKDMLSFQEALEKNPDADLFLWSRFIPWARTFAMPRMRKFILILSRLVTWIFYGVKVSDPHNGYRVIRISALKKITLEADGMHYANEFNEQIGTYKLHFVEVPVHIRYTDYSLSKGQKNSNSIKLGFEMLYKKFF